MTSMTPGDRRPNVHTRPGSMANLHHAMARCPTLDACLRIVRRDIDEHSGLDAETRELVFLRVARLRHDPYAWHNHAHEARALGLEDSEITALEHWRSSERVSFDSRQRAVLAYTDAVVHGGEVPGAVRRALEEELNASEVVGLTLLIGYAWAETAVASGLGLETEEPFVGWELYRGAPSASL